MTERIELNFIPPERVELVPSNEPGVQGPIGPTGPTGAASTVPGPTGPTGPTGPVTGAFDEIIKTSTATLTASEVSGTTINNYGQTADVTLTLPTAAEGLSFMVVLGTTVAKYFRIKAGSSDKIYLDGTAGTDGYYVGIDSAVAGAVISFVAFQTGLSVYDWLATSISGAWVKQ